MSTYELIKSLYILTAVRNVWGSRVKELHAKREGKNVRLAGDGRCDSPGHCAKYGCYTLMDADTHEILHVELVPVIYR